MIWQKGDSAFHMIKKKQARIQRASIHAKRVGAYTRGATSGGRVDKVEGGWAHM